MPGGRRRPAPLTALPPPPAPARCAPGPLPLGAAAGRCRAAPRRLTAPPPSKKFVPRGTGRRLAGPGAPSRALRAERSEPSSSAWGRGHFLFLRAAGRAPRPAGAAASRGQRFPPTLPPRARTPSPLTRSGSAPPPGQGWKPLAPSPAPRPAPGLASPPPPRLHPGAPSPSPSGRSRAHLLSHFHQL